MQPEIQVWKIDRFVPYARNPRKNDAAVDKMSASFAEFGFKIPVLNAQQRRREWLRYLRLKGARKTGVTDIPMPGSSGASWAKAGPAPGVSPLAGAPFI